MMLSLRGGYEYVDLGLPSGLKWAKCNVGAETETEYGDYFMWGSTRPNTADECVWEHAPFNGGYPEYNADAFNSVKNTACPNGVLAKEYDAATQIMGGDWRMPTKDELKELLNNTTNEWMTLNGVSGRKFISKTDESKYIFIPAAGHCYNGSVGTVGDDGVVWSSSFNTYYSESAWYLYFNSGGCGMYGFLHYFGRSIRPVTD